MLPFKTRRTSQPQGAAEIDWSNPITKSLAVAVSPVGSYGMTKLLGPNPITFVGTPAQTVSNKGIGKTGGYMTSQAGLNDAPLSIFIRCIITFSAATKGIFSFGNEATEGIPRILIQQNNLSLRIYNVVGEYVFTSGNVITLGKPIDIAYTHNGSSGALYVDGVRIYEDSSTFSSGTNRFANWYVFSGYGGIPSGSMLEHFQWSRALSASEIKSLSDNEYQLFKPQSRSLWIPGAVSSGSSHTLTGANSTQSSTSGTGGVTQAHLLTGASCSQSATSGTGAITQGATHILTGANSTQAALSGTGVITQGHMLVGAGATQAASSGTGAITQRHLLTGAGSSQTAESGTGAIITGAVHVLAAANASQSATSSAVAITQRHTLISAPIVQDSVASASAIVQRHMLLAAACSQAAVSGVGAIFNGVIVAIPPGQVSFTPDVTAYSFVPDATARSFVLDAPVYSFEVDT